MAISIPHNEGSDVTIDKYLQFERKIAIQGNKHVAIVKNTAIDIFATNVLYLEPTYSKPINKILLMVSDDVLRIELS